jgi:hypothetical protein
MMPEVANPTTAPVRKTVTVEASVEHAFKVFTDGFDTWWPRSHHIGKSPMRTTRVDLEHRHFERHGAGGASIRAAVDALMGWGELLKTFAERAGS